ncbi:ankyrin repeat domain-containing protein [Variovorax sp. J22R133]|uniref:ankyrin repeat domain-containing protein n=1 Tax=Variovorax brevis TaxID=3053503 RepID=UPI002576A822|nr:ankyrin repeat domain-containing protein [Variovorax sp. J22R133]MDM0110929.1 ankyrin repeat domain-containing protein [Variovorax sp. J22R133]
MRNYFKYFLYAVVFAGFTSAVADANVDFFRAVRSDNPGGVKDMIAQGFDPNVKDESGQTALLLAMREPAPRVIQVLVDSPKVNIDGRNSKDETPLMMAALKGQQDLVVKLLARDADVNKTGWTPLHYAATSGNVPIMKILIEKYAFIDAQSPNGTTPLMMAAMYGSAEAVKYLIDEGADQKMKNEQGMTAADFAARGKRPDAMALLAKSAAPAPAKRPADGKW